MADWTRSVRRPRLGFGGRSQTFSLAVVFTAGMLVAGLAFPFIFGHAEVTAAGSAGTQLNLSGLSPTGSLSGTTANGAASAGTAGSQPAGAGGGVSTGTLGSSGPGTGNTAPGSAGVGSAAAPHAASSLTASDRGVTPTTIKVGVTILDLGGVGRLGVSLPGYSPAHQEQIWTGYFNELNKKGGINGRKVLPVYQEFDITNSDNMQAGCIALTQDDKVFAVLDTAGYYGPPVLCLTQQNDTPFVTVGEIGTPSAFYSESNGNLFTLHASGDRQMENMATVLTQAGALKGKTIGILGVQGEGNPATFAVLNSTLKALGHPAAYEYDLSSDTGTAASQMPVAVNEMITHRVNAVFLLSNIVFNGQFVDQAQGENYTPAYFTSDWGTGENMGGQPASFNGALAVTETNAFDWNVGLGQPAYDAECQKRGTADSGYVWDPSSSASINHPADMRDCSMVDIFTWAATKAGPNLTRAGFVAAMRQLGNIPVATFPPYATFGPNRYDAASFVRIDQYQGSRNCGSSQSSPGCFWPITQFQKSPY